MTNKFNELTMNPLKNIHFPKLSETVNDRRFHVASRMTTTPSRLTS